MQRAEKITRKMNKRECINMKQFFFGVKEKENFVLDLRN